MSDEQTVADVQAAFVIFLRGLSPSFLQWRARRPAFRAGEGRLRHPRRAEPA